MSFKYLQVRPEKTGGDTLYRLFKEDDEVFTLPFFDEDGTKVLDSHSHITHLENLPFFNDVFKFGFVRNPWDRMLSMYLFGYKKINHRHHKFIRGATFEEYVLHIDNLSPYPMVPQVNFFYSNNKRVVDFIGRFENFEIDFYKLCAYMGKNHLQLPVCRPEHRTNHGHYSHYYTTLAKDSVYAKYRSDVKSFGYDFEQEEVEMFEE